MPRCMKTCVETDTLHYVRLATVNPTCSANQESDETTGGALGSDAIPEINTIHTISYNRALGVN